MNEKFQKLGFYPADCWVHSLDEEGLYDLYCGELLEGMLPWQEDPALRQEALEAVLQQSRRMSAIICWPLTPSG